MLLIRSVCAKCSACDECAGLLQCARRVRRSGSIIIVDGIWFGRWQWYASDRNMQFHRIEMVIVGKLLGFIGYKSVSSTEINFMGGINRVDQSKLGLFFVHLGRH